MVKVIVGMWRRRWMIATVAWLTAIAGWLATLVIPDMYESRAQVYINTETALDSSITTVSARPNLEKQVRIIRTQLLSRDNIEQLIYETGLDAGVGSPIELERLIDKIASEIDVESQEEQYFVISYLNTDPVIAQRVVSAVLDLFIEQNLNAAIADLDNSLASLDREVSDRKVKLDIITTRIAEFRRQNADELAGSDRLERRLEAKEEELSRLQDQIASSTLRRERLVTSLSTTQRYDPGSDLDTLKFQLASLQSQFNESYPDIVRLKAQIQSLESGSAALPENRNYTALNESLRAVTDEIRTLGAREIRVQNEIDQLALDAAETPEAQAVLFGLLRESAQLETTYKQLLKKRSDVGLRSSLNQAGGAIEYRRFETPKVAVEPSWPPRGLLTLAILAIALGVGCGLSFILSQLDKTYTQTSELEEALGLPVLGSVSHSPTRKHIINTWTDRGALLGIVGGLVVIAGTLYWVYELRIGGEQIEAMSAERGGIGIEGIR